jgi:hypothetical protein
MLRKNLFVLVVCALAGGLVAGCVIKGSDACDLISCDNHGTCIEVGGLADCACDTGFVNDGPLHCVPEGSQVDLDWAFGPGVRSCADAHVADVRVQMFDGAVEILNNLVDCETGGAVIAPVEDGSYTIDLTGLSAAGDEWYFATEDVLVDGSNVDLATVVLAPTGTGDLRFEWAFGLSELGCVAAGVSRVRVEVYDQSGGLEFEASPIPNCSEAGSVVTNFALGTWNLVLEGVCDADLSTGFVLDADLVVAHPGENDYGTVVLEEVGGGCP